MKRARRLVMLLPVFAVAVVFFAITGAASAHPDCAHIELSEGAEDCLMLGESYEVGEWEVLDDVPGGNVGEATGTFTKSDNLTPLGYSARNVPFSGTGSSLFNSDPALQGNLLYQGTYAGFRIIDVSDPTNPTQLINYTNCAVGQGDVVVYGNILVRAWDSPSTSTCAGQATGTSFEGVHIFDVSDPRNPVLLKQIRMASTGSGPFVPGGTLRNNPTALTDVGCGSHTLSLVPDAARGNIYVYSSASSGTCTGIDIIRIPLGNVADSGIVRRAAAGRQCHDTTIHLPSGQVTCAGGNGYSYLTFDAGLPADAPGGIENPALVRSQPISGVGIGHSSAFSNDGKTVIFGHEPGGGSQAQCQPTSSVVNRTLFFFDAVTGAEKGRFIQPRPQTARENCTWHNFNVVPTNRADIGVIGSYQMGITVIDFTDPANVQQIAFADPDPLSPTSLILGGDWSTYWFNGKIYESDIRRGIMVWDLADRRTQGAKTTNLWNAQTQTFGFEKDRTKPRIIQNLPAAIGLNRSVAASFSCVDDQGAETSDIWSCDGTVANGAALDSSSVGTKSFTIRAEDGAGNIEEQTFTYEVIWDEYAGFFRPIGDENNNTAGSAVPVKFSLGADYGMAVLADGYPMSKACGADDSTAVSTKQAEAFAYVNGEYRYVWKTEKAWGGTCRELIVKLQDNTIHRAIFNLRKS